MRVNIKATNLELTQAISEYLNKRVGALDKFVNKDDESAMAQVEVGKSTKHHQSGDIFRAEINLHIAGKDLRAVAEKDNLYAAIDEAKDEMVREITSHKAKQRTLLRRGGARIKDFLRGFYGGKQ